MSPTARVSVGLTLGLAAGIALAATPPSPLHSLAAWLEPVGTLWVNGIRMTVIPLIVSLLIVGIASPADTRRVTSLGVRALVLFFVALSSAALFTALVAPPILAQLRLDAAGVAALRASVDAVTASPEVPSLREWLVSLVPANPIRAATDGALLPLIIFSVAFAFAATRIPSGTRESVVAFFSGIADSTLVLVQWILALAPIGIFALALVLGTHLGLSAVGALGYYVAVVVVLHIVIGLALYPLAVVAGRVSLRRFAQATAPAQAVAFSTRSSLASLPALVEGARRHLALPTEITGFVLPLAVSVFKLTSPIYWTVGALFVARLYGVELGPAQIATMAVASVILSASAPGIPSGGLFVQAPIYSAIGLPLEGIAILIAVDTIPDMFKTTLNVTADMAVATIVGRDAES